MMLWPWRELQILRERMKSYDIRFCQLKTQAALYQSQALQTYKDLIASQKGCRRLRRALDRERSKRKQREDHA